jgi:small subunit ribosomal protein S21
LEKTGISYNFAAHLKINQLIKGMIIIPIKEGENIERALKRFKRKFEKTGTMKELRSRQAFSKPSIKRREEIKKAIYIQQLQQKEE